MTNYVGGGFPVIQGPKLWNYIDIYIFIKQNHGVSRTSSLRMSLNIHEKNHYQDYVLELIIKNNIYIQGWKITLGAIALRKEKPVVAREFLTARKVLKTDCLLSTASVNGKEKHFSSKWDLKSLEYHP